MASANVSLLTRRRRQVHPLDGRRRRLVHLRLRRGHDDLHRPLGVVGPHRRRLRHRGRPVAERHQRSHRAHQDARTASYPEPALQPDAGDAGQQQRRERRAQSLGAGAPDSFNVYGDEALSGRQEHPRLQRLGVELAELRHGQPHDHGLRLGERRASASSAAASARWASRRSRRRTTSHDQWGVPYANIELTPMIGGNDAQQRAVHARRRGHGGAASPSRRGSPACTTGRTTATPTARRARRRRRATRSATPARTAT